MPYFPYNRYPYSNFHDLNLDWILDTLQELYRRITSYEGSATPYESNPLMDGVADPGHIDQFARGDHRHPTDTSRASVEALQAVQDRVPGPSNGNPRMDGEANPGFYDNYSRADHVHPSDTSKLDKTGGEVMGLLDIVPRRCYGALTSPGWYRVCAINFGSYGEAIGASGGILRFAITDSYVTYPNDAHTITLLLAHNKVTFVDEASAANGYLEIDKIRYTFTEVAPYKGFVDIHYMGRGGGLLVGVSFEYTGVGLDRPARVAAQSLQSVEPSPSGETVFTEYTFMENTEGNGTITPNSGVSISEVEVKREGRTVFIRFTATAAISANTQMTLGTISGVPIPNQPIRWLTGGGAHPYDASSPVYAILGTSGIIDVYSPSAINSVNITLSYIV